MPIENSRFAIRPIFPLGSRLGKDSVLSRLARPHFRDLINSGVDRA